MDFVDYHLSRATQLNFPIRKLALTVHFKGSMDFSRIDTWLEFARQINVEQLCIFVPTGELLWTHLQIIGGLLFLLPFSMLTSKSLRSVHLQGCKLDCGSFVGNPIGSFCTLKELCLSASAMSEDVLENLIRFCQGIETLVLEGCTLNFEFLKLSKFHKLKKAIIEVLDGHGSLKTVDIIDTNLECFKCDAGTGDVECRISPQACAGIRELTLVFCSMIPPNLFENLNLTTTFPLVEVVCIKAYEIGTLKAASNVLRKLELDFLSFAEKVHIDCPNLTSLHCRDVVDLYVNCPKLSKFEYTDQIPKRVFFTSKANLEESNCHSPLRFIDISDTFSLATLVKTRAFLDQIMGNLTYLYADLMMVHLPTVVAMQASPRYNVHLQVSLWSETWPMMDVDALVDAMLWIIRPTTWTILPTTWTDDFTIVKCRAYHMAQYLCESLSKKSQDNICDEQQTQPCWMHQLEDFQVEYPKGIPLIKEDLAALPERYRASSVADVYIKFQWSSCSVGVISQESIIMQGRTQVGAQRRIFIF